jgi:hypothetical protein
MKYVLFVFISLISTGMFAQTGIGTITPHSSAKLDVTRLIKDFCRQGVL